MPDAFRNLTERDTSRTPGRQPLPGNRTDKSQHSPDLLALIVEVGLQDASGDVGVLPLFLALGPRWQ